MEREVVFFKKIGGGDGKGVGMFCPVVCWEESGLVDQGLETECLRGWGLMTI